MAWSFRRRVKIAPGVHINLSKSGVGASFGPRGAKVSVGPKGTYLHTGIPGTGIYNRQKIGPGLGKETPSSTPSGFSSPNSSPSDPVVPTNDNTSENGGCLHIIMWVLCISSAILIGVLIHGLSKTEKELQSIQEQYGNVDYSQMEEQDSIGESQEYYQGLEARNNVELTIRVTPLEVKLREFRWLLIILIAIFVLTVCWLLTHMPKPSNTSPDQEITKTIEHLRGLIEKTNDPLKKKILGNYLGHILSEDAENRLKPLAEKWTKRYQKNPGQKCEEQLHIFEQQYKDASDEAKTLIIDVDGELSELEKNNYKDFCDSYKAFKASNRAWSILSSVRNSELKSSAYTTVERSPVVLKTGTFVHLQSAFQVPLFPGVNKIPYYFYPRFVIHGNSIDKFDVIEIDKIELRYKSTRFIETGNKPIDAKQVDTTYKYVNKDGGPDRRYSYNPVMPVLLYGDIKIMPFGDTYQVSNNEAAMQLDLAFKTLKAGCLSKNKANDEHSDDGHNNNDLIEPQVHSNIITNHDELLKAAAKLAVTNQRVSTSDIQRGLGVGYARASKILDELETLSIIGPMSGSSQREVLIKDLDTLAAIFSYIDSNMSSRGCVNEQYFNDLLTAAKSLQSFGKRLSLNNEFCKVVDDTISGNVKWNGKLLTDGKDKIPVFLWTDVIHSYMGLGHELNLSSNEGLGILIYNTMMVKPTFTFDYSMLDHYRKNLVESSETFTRNTVASMSGNTNVFLLEFCLKEFDKQLHNQYVVLLYRFASLIAKADKNITASEAEWLKKIMALKEPEAIDDVIKSVDPISQPQPKKKTSPAKLRSAAADELNALIGLSSVKTEIDTLTNYIKVQKMRQEKGMKVTPVSLHCVFTGNPGTGKTTVARIVSEIYKELGLLQKGHLIETDRSGLVAEYVGQTAVKTNKIIDSALDGILFIDEAYSLVDGGNSDYGKEAISTLLKRMEDDRGRLVVILAGYTNDMKRFIDSNPGLQSRFNRYIEFPDYTADELFQIFEANTKKYEYSLTEDASTKLKSILNEVVDHKDKNFGNGRFVRNLFEKVIENQANRISLASEVTAESLATIEEEDINNAV